MLIGTWIGTPHLSRISLEAKYQSGFSLKISQIFSGFFGGGVAQLDKTEADKHATVKAFAKYFTDQFLNLKTIET